MSDDQLRSLGWRPFFSQQVDPDSEARLVPMRVLGVHRDRLQVRGETDETTIRVASAPGPVTVGDWLLVDREREAAVRCLDRQSLFRRGAAGEASSLQLIAANVDTLFVVTSANDEFNPARLERYLALAAEAGVFPVIVLTKIDTCANPVDYRAAAGRLAANVLVEAVDARDPSSVAVLEPWCGDGQTVALLGSSGVGKSTLINTLCGADQPTREIRAADQRGRHTTTGRSMHRLPQGAWLIDTPGMRELKLVGMGDALEEVFADIADLARQCRFVDCAHDSEPGCAVRAAIEAGAIDAERMSRFRKLVAEDRRNTESLAERRARDRATGKLYRSVQSAKYDRRNRRDD